MGGGLMQLVAYGAQDVYLTGNPQITFFKVVYRRHSNFSMECIEQTINGSQNTGGGNGTVTVSRNGDLVHKVYVTCTDGAHTNGSAIVKEVELEIGGQRIDRHTHEYMNVVTELITPESKAIGLKVMQSDIGTLNGDGVKTLHIPLQFWFCRNPGLALPLIALQYHEVKLKFTWGKNSDASGVEDSKSCKVWCDYIYLDTDERRRFAQVSHEYLIEQVQYHNASGASNKLNFNHPVKELLWVSDEAYSTARLTLNGHDRFADQPVEYFQLRQMLDHHTAVPRQNLPSSAQLTSNYVKLTTDMIAGKDLASDKVPGGVNFGTADVSVLTTEIVVGKIATASGGTPGDMRVAPLDDGETYVAGRVSVDTVKHACYLAFATDLVNRALFPAGTFVKITGSGARFIGGTAAGSTMFATITLNVAGTKGGATNDIADDTQILQFDRPLFNGVALIEDGELNISSIQLVVPDTANPSGARTSAMTRKINCYSFALKPEEHQPSGTCNFSRIDTAKLETGNPLHAVDVIYAVNYNVLRIMSGMGGLAYSN